MSRNLFQELKRRPSDWIVVGLFSAMAFPLVLPTGAASALILLVCGLLYLLCRPPARLPVLRLSIFEWWFLLSMALYPALVVVSIILRDQPYGWHYFDKPARFLLALSVYWAIRKSEATPVGLVMGSIVGSMGAGALAMFQWTVLTIDRPGGFTNPIPFADIALLLTIVALAPVSLPKGWRIIRVLGVGLGLTAVILAQTRGAWLAVPFLACLAMKWLPDPWRRLAWLCTAVVLVSSALLLAALMIWYFATPAAGLVHEHFDQLRIASLIIRLETWQAAWAMFMDRPWAGVGLGQYGHEAKAVLEANGVAREYMKSAMTHAHNDFLHLGATMGVFGVAAYLIPLGILYLAGRYLCRQDCRTMGVLLQMFAVGEAIFSMTQSQLSHNISTTFFAMTGVSLMALGFNDLQRKHQAVQ